MSDDKAEFKVDVTDSGGELIVRPAGEVDMHTSPQLRAALLPLLDKKAARVVIDLAKVSYIDSSGVGTLVEFRRRSKHGAIALCGLQPRVRSVFEITKLDQFFTIVGSPDEARGK